MASLLVAEYKREFPLKASVSKDLFLGCTIISKTWVRQKRVSERSSEKAFRVQRLFPVRNISANTDVYIRIESWRGLSMSWEERRQSF